MSLYACGKKEMKIVDILKLAVNCFQQAIDSRKHLPEECICTK